MLLLERLLLIAAAAGVAVFIGNDVVRDLQNRSTTWTNGPFIGTIRGRDIGGPRSVIRDKEPLNYWGLIIFKMIALIGLTAMAAFASFSVLQP
jgi:hypothetical protein